MNWKDVIKRWRELTVEERRMIWLRNIPCSVARSMEFEGEPVDPEMLRREFEVRLAQRENRNASQDTKLRR